MHWRTYRKPLDVGLETATILHYHMPKPQDILSIVVALLNNSSARPGFYYAFGLNREGYLQALALFFLHADPETPLDHPVMRNFIPAYQAKSGARIGSDSRRLAGLPLETSRVVDADQGAGALPCDVDLHTDAEWRALR